MRRLVAPLREALRWVLRRPPSDWAGPDAASAAARRAVAIEVDDRHEVVCLGQPLEGLDPRLARLAGAGHRVWVVSSVGERDRGDAVRERSPNLFEVRLRDPLFESMDRLRRELGLGATVSVVAGENDLRLADRLRAERGWPVLRLEAFRGEAVPDGALATALALAFPLISIVIVTCNNRDVNRLCFESLFARTEWPNLEVLAIDNGSTDGTLELLDGFRRRHANLQVVALGQNAGFPAACNIGLARAAGDPVVLLNNDTVLTRGWLTALVRHLVEDRRLGMVGPVTNAIANEARVEVGYTDLRRLPAWAAEWIRAHDGETIPISMLAFFCVALRRAAYESIGPLDERFGLGLFEDGDYNRRARARGWKIRCARDSFVHHWQYASFRRLGKDAYFALYEDNRRKYAAKWREAPEEPVSPS